MAIGTRARNGIALSSALNKTLPSETTLDTDKGGFVIVASDVTFTSDDTISSGGGTFPTSLAAGQLIEVTGSPLNSRVYELVSNDGTDIVVNPAQIQAEDPGATIHIRAV
jgi:hypothetical protein